MDYQSYTFPNGFRVVYRQEKTPIAYCGVVINTGSRDELKNEYGMAHFVEHLLFKGTKKRRSTHIINRLENIGGDLNAFTSKEETVIHSAILAEYLERAIELIADITLHSTFPQKEMDKEKEVILDEIDSYNDSPSELIYDDFEEILFQGHELGHHILGDPNLLKNYTTKDVVKFTQRLYQAEKILLFVSGNIQFKTLLKWAEKYFVFENSATVINTRTAPVQYSPTLRTIEKGTHQVHVAIGNRAYDMYHPNRLGLYFLNNILGGPGMSSLLNLSLREKHGLVYNVESSYQPFSDSGEWTVYFACDKDDEKKCEQLVYKELKKLRTTKLSDTTLKKYKLQLSGQFAISWENKENTAISLGKSFMRYGKVDDLPTIRQKIDAITADELLKIANEIFIPEQFTVLKYR